MALPSILRGIRARLAAIILLAMTALVVLLVYQQIDAREDDKRRGDDNLRRLATFAAYAERERFQAAERLLVLALQAQALRTIALDPSSTEAFDACTRTLFVLDQLLPETSGFALWDTEGSILCSSEAAKRGEFSVSENLWFRTARERQDFATGGFELSPPDDEPSLGFGIPIRDAAGLNVIAYLSTGLSLNDTNALLAGADLPDTGRVLIIDEAGTIINSSDGRSGERTDWFVPAFGSLSNFQDTRLVDAPGGRRVAAVRITDADDANVAVIVGADKDVLAAPLGETLVQDIGPVVVITIISLIAVWFLAQRWVVRPIGALVGASDAVAHGDLGARARIDAGVSEFERLAASFNQMAAMRERASHAKDDFLGLVSHELKTPITTALGNAEILRRRGDALDADQRQEALADIHESAMRLSAIIDNMLALARLERGAGLESEPIALARLAQVVSDDQARKTGERRVLVRGDNAVLALGGDIHVEQVLRNLIENALKYSPPGSPVEVSVEREGGLAVVRVIDQGEGIEPEERDAVFEPFYRSARTASVAEGIGIGLSVCKRLIVAMGGRIWCGDRPGGGCEFGFALPLVTEEAVAVADEGPIAVPSA